MAAILPRLRPDGWMRSHAQTLAPSNNHSPEQEEAILQRIGALLQLQQLLRAPTAASARQAAPPHTEGLRRARVGRRPPQVGGRERRSRPQTEPGQYLL